MVDISGAFADGIRSGWAQNLNQIDNPEFLDISSWLQGGSFNWVAASQESIELDIRGSGNGFTSALAGEISRFSCAAYESLLDAEPPLLASRSLGWSLVRHYYATFYAAHALLRIGGVSITYISTETCRILNYASSQQFGISPRLTPGLYKVFNEPIDKGTVFIKKVSSGSGGSHQDMWSEFSDFLRKIENEILLKNGCGEGALEAVRISGEIRTSLGLHGYAGWPSKIRNDLHYQHEYGVWFPYQLSRRQSEILKSQLAKWKPNGDTDLSILSDGDVLLKFSSLCNTTTHLLTFALQDIADRSPVRSKGFVNQNPFKLLRHRKVL
jgi:hypothetical protein